MAALVMCLVAANDGWFGVDAYRYFADRGGLPGEHTSIFAPYGGHWEPVVIAVYLLLWHVFGFTSYVPYVLPAILTHLVICWLVFAILRRLGHNAWVSLVAVWLLLFYGAAAEAFTTDAPVALTSALALGLGALYLVLGGTSRRRQLGAMALLLIALGCSVTSVVSIAFVAVFLVGMSRRREAALVSGVPAAGFLLWFAVSGRNGGRATFDLEVLLDVPGAVWQTLVIPLADVSGLVGAGATLTLLVVLATFLSPDPSPAQRAVALAGLSAAVLQLGLSALANAASAGGGIADVLGVGRYRYITLVCMLPAVAIALQWAGRRFARVTRGHSRLVPVLLVTVFIAASTVHGVADLRAARRFDVAAGRQFKDVLFGSVAATALGEKMLHFEGIVFMNGHDIAKLAGPLGKEFLPEGLHPTDEQRFAAESTLYVGVGADTMDLPGPGGITSEGFSKRLSDAFGCRDYKATTGSPLITLGSVDGAQIAVTSDSSLIRTRLRRGDLFSEPKAWTVTPGEPVYIGTSAQLAQLDIAFESGGAFTVCRA